MLRVWPARAFSWAGTMHAPGSHHALQVLFGQGLRCSLGPGLRRCVRLLVVSQQSRHLQVVELNRIIQGGVAPPERNRDRPGYTPDQWPERRVGEVAAHFLYPLQLLLNPTHLSFTKGFTLQASIRNLTTSMCPRNMGRRNTRGYRS